MHSLSEENFKVLIRVRPLNPREKEEIAAYEQSHSKKMKGSTIKMIKMNPTIYSFYTKFYNCNIDEILKIHKKSNTVSVADQ
jgi:DNA topoisomerase VI subunit A